MDDRLVDVPRGLTNVVVAETELGDVRGHEGFYHYRQYSAVDLARRCSVEEVWALLLDGELPGPERLDAFTREVAAAAMPSAELMAALPAIAQSRSLDLFGALRAAVALDGAQRPSPPLFDLDPAARRSEVVRVAAQIPVLIAALTRLRAGTAALLPRADLGLVDDYLFL